MTPGEFITKWSNTKLREHAAAQSHFIDLCKMLGEKAPTDADPKGEWYAFEKGALKTGGGDGWADVWKRGCFAWEYKSPGKDLSAALKQLQYYVRSLESPPLLIVSDMYRIELHTNWTNTVHQVHTLVLEELADARLRQKLKWAFSESDVNELKPGKTREALTKEVAQEFVTLAQNLRDRGHDAEKVAHFVNRMVFCMFAEDVDLLPDKLFKRMLEASAEEPESFAANAQKLFAAMAWSDEAWVIDGADVRVSIVCFDDADGTAVLDGKDVSTILSGLDEPLASGSIDLMNVRPLDESEGRSFLGTKKGGPFDFDGDTARPMLIAPLNPHRRPNSDVLRRRFTGADMVKRPSDRWAIDFGHNISEKEAALYEVPFAYVLKHVKPVRATNRRPWRRDNYWLHSETAPGLRNALQELSRYIGTPRVAKHRLFIWLDTSASIDDGTIGIARDDDTTFGILHSRFHELWSLRMCTWLGVGNDPRYTPTTCFETFPFPAGLTPDIPAADYAKDPRAKAIAKVAAGLNELREAWLNPPDLVQRVPEVVPGYPDRILPVDDKAAAILKKRTLTNLYNERPTWLDNAHRDLDAAVAKAYGWPKDLSDEQILERLFKLNQERAAAQ